MVFERCRIPGKATALESFVSGFSVFRVFSLVKVFAMTLLGFVG